MRMSSLILTVIRSPPDGRNHEAGLRGALTKGLRGYGELINNKQAAKIIADDVVGGANIILSSIHSRTTIPKDKLKKN